MKKSAKVKYLGLAAAALLAVAPVVAPAVSSVATSNLTTVQAATTGITGDFNVKADKLSVKSNAPYYKDSATSETVGKNVAGASLTVTKVHIENGQVSAYGDKTGWVSVYDIASSQNGTLTFTDKVTLNTASDDAVWTDTSDSSTFKPGAGAKLIAKTATVASDGTVNTVTGTQDNDQGNYSVAASDLSVEPAAETLKEDTNIVSDQTSIKANSYEGAQIYGDKGTTKALDGKTISYNKATTIQAYVRDTTNKDTIVAYKIGDGQYVKADAVTAAGLDLSEVIASGKVTTTKDATVYKDSSITEAKDTKIAKGQEVDYSSIVKTADGKVYAYGSDKGYIKASDVTTASTGDTGDLTISVLPSGTTVNSSNKAVTVYTDAATTKASGTKLDTQYDIWDVTRTAKDKSGKVVAYDLGNSQWVKAGDVTTDASTGKLTTTPVTDGTALYSAYKAAQIYSDPDTTKANGTLNTSYNEWTVNQVAKDANGNAVAYDLGSNQWVKASDLEKTAPLSGTFDANAGTPMYDQSGKMTGTIDSEGLFQVFGVTYINGKQAVKLGNDSQWVIAASGDYFPA